MKIACNVSTHLFSTDHKHRCWLKIHHQKKHECTDCGLKWQDKDSRP